VSTRDLVPSDRVTYIIASRVNPTFFIMIILITPCTTLSLFLSLGFDVLVTSSTFECFLLNFQTCTQCNQHRDSSFQKIFLTSSKHRNGKYISTSSESMLHAAASVNICLSLPFFSKGHTHFPIPKPLNKAFKL
jgi:hypothetical protein